MKCIRPNAVWCVMVILAVLPVVGATRRPAASLRQAADRIGILVGTAVDPSRFSEAVYASTLAREFNMVEPENVMKWGTLRPTEHTFNFGPGDQVVAFARAHRMKVRGHNLVWAQYNPGWLRSGQFTPEQLSQLLRDHITTVMKHYAGKVFAWDVVNEAFDGRGQVAHSLWYDEPGIGLAGKGTAYIEQAFRWARAADRRALLFYNDYAAEGLNAKSDAIYAMVKDFKQRGVPIDGVGLQMHVYGLHGPDATALAANMARLAALGVQVQITEMDVGIPIDASGSPRDNADLARQADVYRQVATACAEQPGCTAFQTWGFTDKYTWITGGSRGTRGAPLLFDRSYALKPAYQAVLEAFQAARAGKRSAGRAARGRRPAMR